MNLQDTPVLGREPHAGDSIHICERHLLRAALAMGFEHRRRSGIPNGHVRGMLRVKDSGVQRAMFNCWLSRITHCYLLSIAFQSRHGQPPLCGFRRYCPSGNLALSIIASASRHCVCTPRSPRIRFRIDNPLDDVGSRLS